MIVRAGKGEKARIVPLTRSAYHRLREYIEEARGALVTAHPAGQRALFLSNRGHRLCTAFFHLLAQRACRLAKVKKHVTPHTFRRTFATTLLQNGVSLRCIQELLGHGSLSTTALAYLVVDRAELRRELLKKHPRERFDA